MTRKSSLPVAVLAAIAEARRLPGWNSRSRNVMRFKLGQCALYVVPYRRWVYRRQELRAAAWWRLQRGEIEQA